MLILLVIVLAIGIPMLLTTLFPRDPTFINLEQECEELNKKNKIIKTVHLGPIKLRVYK